MEDTNEIQERFSSAMYHEGEDTLSVQHSRLSYWVNLHRNAKIIWTGTVSELVTAATREIPHD